MIEQKAALRQQLRKQRRVQDARVLRRDSQQICSRLLELKEVQQAKTVFCYVSCGGEVETHGLLERLLEQGKTVVVPRCRESGKMDLVPLFSMEELTAGKYGIPEPPADRPGLDSACIDFTVVPALACGLDGSRLGQGGGYYDRFLARTAGGFAALCQEAFLLPMVPCEAHDRPMKIIITPQRVLRFEEV